MNMLSTKKTNMYNLALTTPISLFVSLAALAGVMLHDTKLDKLAVSIVGAPSVVSKAENGRKAITNDTHTHVERVGMKNMNTSQPRIMPRNEQKKHLLQKSSPKGTHVTDGYRLPIT